MKIMYTKKIWNVITTMNSTKRKGSNGQSRNKKRRVNEQSTKKTSREDESGTTSILDSVRNLIQQDESNKADRLNNGKKNNSDKDKRTIDENLMTKYRPLLDRRGNDEKQVKEAEQFLRLNKIDCTFVGMSQAINKLNQELRTMRMKISSEQIISKQNMAEENKKRVMDFKFFLTKKTYNMFRVTFTMVSSYFIF